MEYTEVPYTQKTKERMKNFGIFGFITGSLSFACLDEPPQPTYILKYPNNIFKKDETPYLTLINKHPYTLLKRSAIAGIFTGLAFAYCAYRISPERKLRKLDAATEKLDENVITS